MGTEILAGALFGGTVLFLSGRRPGKKGMGAGPFAVTASLLFLAAFALRLWLGYFSEGFSTDMDTFKSWGSLVNEVGFSQVYSQDVYLDYPPAYLYVLSFLDRLRDIFDLPFNSSAYTLLMKLPSLAADMLCGGCLLWLGRRKLGETEALLLSAAYLFCPAVLVNSAQWGQVDSVTTAVLLASVLLLYKERYVPSALLYGLSVACKPQMLIFSPLYFFFALKQKKYGKLVLGVLCAVGVILLTAAPFTKGFHFLWLLQKYRDTMNYYHYYSVNAYNIWTLIGWNWKTLPDGLALRVLTLAAPVLAAALCGLLLLGSKRKDALFACPVLLMAVMYLFGIKMHERYLYPVFPFLVLCFLWVPDKRLLRSFGLSALANYLNVAYVLYLFRERGGNYDPNALVSRVMAGAQVLALGYVFYTLWSVYLRGTVKEAAPRSAEYRLPSAPVPADSRFVKWDWVLLATVTFVYATVAFWHLGGHETALTPWAPEEGETAVLRAEEPCDVLYYLPGIAPAADDRVWAGANIQVEISEDGASWTDCGNINEGSTYVFCWAKFRLDRPVSYVRLTALDGGSVLNEAALKIQGKMELAAVSAEGEKAAALTDEQDVVPLYTTYENSAYFDEIYHARTAYEHILGLEPYENTHPPLGKYIISLGIRLFGMNPFGWRFMGTLFGVLMLPVLYHLLKQLFGKTSLCCCGTLLFAFDFMHFTQTRIATIDTYAVFFLLLMYDCMVVFLRRDLLRDGMKRLLPPLALSGLFMGLGAASKWTVAYGAVGLAVLYFGKLFLTGRDLRRAGGEVAPLLRKSIKLCLWCCLFFIAIPFGIYFLVYLPLCLIPHNSLDIWGSFWRYQTTMFNYHSGLKETHAFASPWYEWPFDVRPIWYFSQEGVNAQGQYSTISAMGNPLLWWAGVPALATAGVLWFRERKTFACVVLCGFLSVYLPWMLVPRITFIYHYFTAVPFLVIALMGVFSRFSQTVPGSRQLIPPGHNGTGGRVSISVSQLFLGIFVAANLVLFCVYFPVISGAPTDRSYTDALELFPTWYF